MKRQLIRRNKNQQSTALHTYGTPCKPADFRTYGLWPETTAHTRRLCKRKTKRWAARWKGNHFTSEEIKNFLRSEAKNSSEIYHNRRYLVTIAVRAEYVVIVRSLVKMRKITGTRQDLPTLLLSHLVITD